MEPNIYFQTDAIIHEVKKNLALESRLLGQLIMNNIGLGSKEHPLLIDIDKKTFECVIEALRNGRVYVIPPTETDIVSKFISGMEKAAILIVI